MHILIKREDFSTRSYVLCVGNSALEFMGEDESFALPYREIRDFCFTQGNRGKTYFTAFCAGRMHEGQVLDATEIEPFTAALKEKLGGVINIEVKRS